MAYCSIYLLNNFMWCFLQGFDLLKPALVTFTNLVEQNIELIHSATLVGHWINLTAAQVLACLQVPHILFKETSKFLLG